MLDAPEGSAQIKLPDNRWQLLALLKEHKHRQRSSYAAAIIAIANFLKHGKADYLIQAEGIEAFKSQFQLILYSRKCKEIADFLKEVSAAEIKQLWVDCICLMIGEYGTPH